MVSLEGKQVTPPRRSTRTHAEAARSVRDGTWKWSGTTTSGGAGEESERVSRVDGTRSSMGRGSRRQSSSTITSKGFLPCCLAVWSRLVSTAWACAPFRVRLPPQFLRAPMSARMARSAAECRVPDYAASA